MKDLPIIEKRGEKKRGRKRTGCIYEEFTNAGNVHTAGRFVKGAGMVKFKHRYVGEIEVYGKRYRCRSTNLYSVQAFINGMLAKYGTY